MNPVSMPRVRSAPGPAALVHHLVGVGVPAETVVGLVEDDVCRAGGHVGSRQPGDARSDDGDPAAHACSKGM